MLAIAKAGCHLPIKAAKTAMGIFGSIFIWLRRQGLVFLLVLAAVAFHQFVWPVISHEAAGNTVRNEWKSPLELKAELVELKNEALEDVKVSRTDLLVKSGSALNTALRQKTAELTKVQQNLAERQGIFSSIRPTAIIAREKLKLRRVRLSGEIKVLHTLSARQASELAFKQIRYPSQKAVTVARQRCTNANQSVRAFNRLNSAEIAARNILFGKAEELTLTAETRCKKYQDLDSQRKTGLAKGIAARAKFENSKAALSQALSNLDAGLNGYSLEITEQTIQALLLKALMIFLAILVTPLIIRAIFYHVIAPLAESRASIRISVPGGGTVPIPLSEHSRVSIPVTLGPAEELLVRQDYLQTSSLTGKKETRWLLDYRHVLTSIASGLSFLTRIRGDGEITTVSAVRDPFAELTEIILANGAACVLHPRALVAVVQPVGKTLRITSHWRLLSPNAWLTFQLRYLVFHGPCRLVVKGGRGIRVEQAISGRIFGQDQLVGFSADLSYSVTRTETFWPYFFGREQLFKDKVAQGSGILIIEEAPLSSRQGSGIRRGLEGVVDATMKAFGL